MRICPKCSKRVGGDSKICRDCGAILEDMPDESVPGPVVESTTPFGFPSAAKHQKSVGEVVAESQESAPPDAEAPPWKCPQCGEGVPGTFDVCWKCQTTKDGERAEQSEPVFFPEIVDASRPNVESETAKFLKTLEVDQPEVPPSQSACPRCGSSKMMYGVTVQDQGQGSNGDLRVVVCGDPSALIFKDRLYSELKAKVIKLLDRIDNLQEMVDAPSNFRRKYCEESRLLADVIGDADPELKAELLEGIERLEAVSEPWKP